MPAPSRRKVTVSLLTLLGACATRRVPAAPRPAPASPAPAPTPSTEAPLSSTEPSTGALVSMLGARYAGVLPAEQLEKTREGVARTLELARTLRATPLTTSIDPLSVCHRAGRTPR